MVDAGDPDQYNRYASEREQPFWDLARLIAHLTSAAILDQHRGEIEAENELVEWRQALP